MLLRYIPSTEHRPTVVSEDTVPLTIRGKEFDICCRTWDEHYQLDSVTKNPNAEITSPNTGSPNALGNLVERTIRKVHRINDVDYVYAYFSTFPAVDPRATAASTNIAAKLILIDPSEYGSVLMLDNNRWNVAIGDCPHKWNKADIPGGGGYLKSDRTVWDTLVREVKQEVDYRIPDSSKYGAPADFPFSELQRPMSFFVRGNKAEQFRDAVYHVGIAPPDVVSNIRRICGLQSYRYRGSSTVRHTGEVHAMNWVLITAFISSMQTGLTLQVWEKEEIQLARDLPYAFAADIRRAYPSAECQCKL